MAGAGRLDVALGLDAAEFTAGLTKAELDAKKFQANLARIGSQVGTAIGAGFIAAGTAAALLTKSAIDAADHLNDLSKSSSVAVEELGGIGFAASQAGTDLDGVAASFGKLNLKIAEAARGEKEASEAFKVLGISVKDASGKTRNADAIFRDIAAAFSQYADGPEKAALGNALFGKSYQSLLPLLADGGQALQDNIEYYKRFGGTTTETAKAADEFNDTLGKLQLVTGQLGRNLATELLPPLQAVADEFLRVAENSSLFSNLAKAARVVFETIAVLGANVVFVFEGIGREIAAIAAQMTALATLDFDGFRAISDAVKEDGERARKELDKLEKRILGLAAGPSLASRIGTANPDRMLERLNRAPLTAPRLSGPEVKPQKDTIDENTQAFARYVDQLQSSIEKTEQLTKTEEVLRAIEQNRFGELIPQQREVLLFLAKQIDAQTEYERLIAHNAELDRQANEDRIEFQRRIDDLTGRGKIKKDLDDLKLLDEAFKDGLITLEEYGAALDKIAGFDKDIKNVDDAAHDLGMTFSSALEDAIVDFNSLRDVLSGLEKDLVRIGTRKLVTEPLSNFMTDLFKGLGGGGGGIFSGFLSSLFGGSQNLTGVFASGTDFVPRDGLAMVHRGERIVPARENMSSRTTSNTINIQFHGETSRSSASQLATEIARRLSIADRRFA